MGIRRSLLDAADVAKHVSARGLVQAMVGKRRVLNAPSTVTSRSADAAASSEDPTVVAQSLRAVGRRLEAAALDDEGRVDYRALAGSDAHRALEEATRALPRLDPTALESDAERIAFWMNVYNVLAIHGVVALGLRRSVMEDPTFFRKVAYRVGPHDYVLDEVENGVLRRNASPPLGGEPLFSAEDPRRATSPSIVDARIHAALVCASTSCPAVRFYDPGGLDAQLDAATRAFVAEQIVVDHPARTLRLPLIFRYYADDFGGERGARDFVLRHASHELAEELERGRGYRVDYARYDWSLNQAG